MTRNRLIARAHWIVLAVTVKSRRTVTVFNICGNDFRLIATIHYDQRKVFVLRFLTHAEYSKNNWKQEL